MNRQEILEKVNEILRDIFEDDTLVITEETTAKDVEGWDSLRHITIIENVEDEFDMRFTMMQVNGMKNVGEMLDIIEKQV